MSDEEWWFGGLPHVTGVGTTLWSSEGVGNA